MASKSALRAIVSQSREILIYDDIVADGSFGGITAKDFRTMLSDFDDDVEISVRINSDGGEVTNALSIYRALAEHPARVVAHVDGIAASSASVILMAADSRRISESAFVMIHNPRSFEVGEAADLRKMADLLDQFRDQILGIYAARTGQSRERVQQWMDAETWFDADESLANGFADEITANKAVAAKWDLSYCRHVPTGVRELTYQPKPVNTRQDDQRLACRRLNAQRVALTSCR